MTTTNKTLVEGATTSSTSAEIKYTSPSAGKGTKITAVTAVNTSVSTGSYSIYVVSDSSAPSATDSLVRSQSLQADYADTPPEVINQFVPAGGTIQVQTNVSGNIAFRISGVEYT
jgi:hypothetical protein